MKGQTQSLTVNPNKITQADFIIDKIVYDGNELYIAKLQFARPSLNCQYGKDYWECGHHETQEAAEQAIDRKYREVMAVIRAARKLPRKWMKLPNGKIVSINHKEQL